MKKMKKVLSKYSGVAMLNAVALLMAVQTVNSACWWIHHQSKVPTELQKFRKF